MNITFFDRFSINNQVSNFMQSPPVGSQLLCTDRRTERQTGMSKLFVILRTRLISPWQSLSC